MASESRNASTTLNSMTSFSPELPTTYIMTSRGPLEQS
jgi:hypothetical protein